MANFELQQIPKIPRPDVFNARGMWKYAILSELRKVKWTRREELWRQAGLKGAEILAHLRMLIKEKGSFDLDHTVEVNENYLAEMPQKIKSLELAMEELNNENKTLRKMLKTFLTPIAKEEFSTEDVSLSEIERQIGMIEVAVPKENKSSRLTSTKIGRSTVMGASGRHSGSFGSPGSTRLRFGGSMELDPSIDESDNNSNSAADLKFSSHGSGSFSASVDPKDRAKSMNLSQRLDKRGTLLSHQSPSSKEKQNDSEQIVIHSPYEKFVPPIELTKLDTLESPRTERAMSKQQKKQEDQRKQKSPQLSPLMIKKSPSYEEREAMRQAEYQKKINKSIVVRIQFVSFWLLL
jgi:hypothetical protein